MTRRNWTLLTNTPTHKLWVDQFNGSLIAIAKPDDYDFWNIYDSTDTAVDGTSLGPFETAGAAVSRIQQDFPGVSLDG